VAWKLHSDAGRVVREPSFVDVMGTNRQRWGRHAFAQPAAASASVFASAPSIAAGRPA